MKTAGATGAGRNGREAGGVAALRPKYIPLRETMKKVSGEVPLSLAEELTSYIEFVTETTGLDPKPTTGEIIAEALREYFKSDKSFPLWKKQKLVSEVGDAVDNLAAGSGAGKAGGQAASARS